MTQPNCWGGPRTQHPSSVTENELDNVQQTRYTGSWRGLIRLLASRISYPRYLERYRTQAAQEVGKTGYARCLENAQTTPFTAH